MPSGPHSLGPTCALHEDDADIPLSEGSDTPAVRAQFFYVSTLPIDDPLSPVPPISAAASAANHPPQPFSTRDNAALEEAWQGCQSDETSKDGARSSSRPISRQMFSFPKFKEGIRVLSPSPSRPRQSGSRPRKEAENGVLEDTYSRLPHKPNSNDHKKSNGKSAKASKSRASVDSTKNSTTSARNGSKTRGRSSEANSSRAATTTKESEVMLKQDSEQPAGNEKPLTEEELALQNSEELQQLPDQVKHRRHRSPFHRHRKDSGGPERSTSRPSTPRSAGPTDQPPQLQTLNISGKPFARAPSTRNAGGHNHIKTPSGGFDNASVFSDGSDEEATGSGGRGRKLKKANAVATETEKPKTFVPVGVSRLHLVEMPHMMMKPIYWSPINDTSKVIRATWFYKDTGLPVPIDVANQLEVGYEDIKPYLDSYQDELQACIENGASAEMKVVHRLWPEAPKKSRPNTANSKADLEEDCRGFTNGLPTKRENIAVDPDPPKEKQQYSTHSVIYSDRKNAQILRPSLLPSMKQNRRPLSSIRKGRQIGVAVVRGFDRKAWLRLHPDPKMDEKAAHAKVGAYMSQSGDATTRGRRKSCTTCDDSSKSPNVSDLVLVIHGIGQKLSERVDSYHFTHAVNDVRRQFNVELSTEAVSGTLKRNTGIMVLPVNWRLTVSFDDETRAGTANAEEKEFDLKDITPETLPAVRSIISDVMLDIPYYLSHHKDKMTSAVIREANRVYRLWCRNNPGFQESGRVHLIAHSLGSVMAMDILSNQPTKLPEDIRLDQSKPSEKMFEFDTSTLFTCGSPCGFFLLLNNARLIPRKGREKPGMDGEDHGSSIAKESGYGCMAVDNIYNILHRNDPVSYLLNASVDTDYAASLQPASVPPATAGFWSKMSNSLRFKSIVASDAYTTKPATARPQMQSMPSTVEMDTHNFTREEIAEKRMYLLNENGQIDFYLSSSGGPLEIQYLSMLSAHSSYWLSQDFVRFLVMEIGRKSGKANTLPVLRARKKREWKRGDLT